MKKSLPEDAPLAAVWRGEFIESFHRGRVAICDPAGKILDATGDPEGHIYLRSSAKTFQALPMVLSGAADEFGFSEEEIAVVCASHNGEERHLAAVRSILQKAGLDEGALQSGAHPPLYAPAAARLAKSGEEPRPIHGNCSGKHAGMLTFCAYEGWDPAGYRNPDHPVQRRIRQMISEVCTLSPDDIKIAGDNCGVPTFAVPLANLAIGFARLATGEGLSDELAGAALRIRNAMRDHPYMVAGTDRFDTDLMQRTDLIAKSGAEAVFAAGSPEGWGVALKISDGASRAVRPAAVAALANRVKLPDGFGSVTVRNLHGEEVGEVAGYSG